MKRKQGSTLIMELFLIDLLTRIIHREYVNKIFYLSDNLINKYLKILRAQFLGGSYIIDNKME
jgi:uncharacterized protein YggT (Ycf19 family)